MFQLSTDQRYAAESGAKLAGAWGSVGVTQLTDFTAWAHLVAEIGAATLTILLVSEFVIKKIILPLIAKWKRRKKK